MTDKPQDLTNLTVIQTGSAIKTQLQLPLAETTLGELKAKLCKENETITNIRSLRVFYLGRELKSDKKTLEHLGIGKKLDRLQHHVLHCHVLATGSTASTVEDKTIESTISSENITHMQSHQEYGDDDDKEAVENSDSGSVQVLQEPSRPLCEEAPVIDLLDDDEEEKQRDPKRQRQS